MRGPSPENHHLFRVRIHRDLWKKYQAIARTESKRLEYHVTASDLARAAMTEWASTHEEASRLGALRPPGANLPTP